MYCSFVIILNNRNIKRLRVNIVLEVFQYKNCNEFFLGIILCQVVLDMICNKCEKKLFLGLKSFSGTEYLEVVVLQIN